MPTKRNHAGNQQNYVPAGNGDASGEYGDNVNGSNKHFTSFQQPDEGKNVVEEQDNDNKGFQNFSKENEIIDSEKEEPINHRENAKNNFMERLGEKSRNDYNSNFATELFDDCDESKVYILENYYKQNTNLTINFERAGAGAAGYASGDSYIATDHEKGTVRHETGHTFDVFFGKTLPENEKYGYGSRRLVTRFLDENGDSFNDIIHRELGTNPYEIVPGSLWGDTKKVGRDKPGLKAESAERIKNTYEKYAGKVYDEITGIPNSYDRFRELDKMRDDWINQAQEQVEKGELGQKYEKLRQEVQKASEDYLSGKRAQGINWWTVQPKDDPQIREMMREKDEARNSMWKGIEEARENAYNTFQYKDEFKKLLEGRRVLRNKLDGIDGIVGDSFDYLKVGSTKFQTRGHGNSYFTNGKRNRCDIFSCEIFANMFDCYIGKDKWKYDCIKEMIPKTAAIFEKIIERYGK